MRKGAVIAACCGFTFLAGWAFGQVNTGSNNGTRWKSFSSFEKNLYALGFSRGYEQGFLEGAGTGMAVLSTNPPKNLTPEQKSDALRLAAQAREHHFEGTGVAISEITATMDAFYDDFRNMGVCWNDAFLLSSATLAGRTPAEAVLEKARQEGSKTGCK